MKAATGELNLTVITIVAIAGIMLVFTTFLWPNIQTTIEKQWESISNNSDEITGSANHSGSDSGIISDPQ